MKKSKEVIKKPIKTTKKKAAKPKTTNRMVFERRNLAKDIKIMSHILEKIDDVCERKDVYKKISCEFNNVLLFKKIIRKVERPSAGPFMTFKKLQDHYFIAPIIIGLKNFSETDACDSLLAFGCNVIIIESLEAVHDLEQHLDKI